MMFTLLQTRTLLFTAWHLVYYGMRNIIWKVEGFARVFHVLLAGCAWNIRAFLVLHGSVLLARSGPLDRVSRFYLIHPFTFCLLVTNIEVDRSVQITCFSLMSCFINMSHLNKLSWTMGLTITAIRPPSHSKPNSISVVLFFQFTFIFSAFILN